MNLFINTFSIVAGIIVPLLILATIIFVALVINDIVQGWKKKQEYKLEQEYKAPPYDDIQLSQPPNPTMFTVRLIKDGKPVWEQSYDKGEIK